MNKTSVAVTPNKPHKCQEADTVKKTRFFEAYDPQTRGEESLQSLASKHGITKRTACNWLQQRRIPGSPAYRRGRNTSQRLGRKPQLTDDQLQRLLSPLNPARNQYYKHQIQHFKLPCKTRTLQRALEKRTNHARRYKLVRVK